MNNKNPRPHAIVAIARTGNYYAICSGLIWTENQPVIKIPSPRQWSHHGHSVSLLDGHWDLLQEVECGPWLTRLLLQPPPQFQEKQFSLWTHGTKSLDGYGDKGVVGGDWCVFANFSFFGLLGRWTCLCWGGAQMWGCKCVWACEVPHKMMTMGPRDVRHSIWPLVVLTNNTSWLKHGRNV